MGYYLQTPGHLHNKARIIAEKYNGKLLGHPPARYEDIPEGKALIVVVDNGAFEAAAFCYSTDEFEVFTDPDDPRPVEYVLIDWEKACELTDFKVRT